MARIGLAGAVERFYELPCVGPTSCTFGGEDLKTLFVTSARFTLTPEHLATHPQEGNLFAIEGVGEGRAEPLFGAFV